MPFKTLCYSVCAVLFVTVCGALNKLSKCKEIFRRYTLGFWSWSSSEKRLRRNEQYHNEPGSGIYPQAGTYEKVSEQAKPGASKKVRLDLDVDKGLARPSCRRKIEAALPILLQAVELDNAGSLEAVGAYKQVARLFDDALEILNNGPRKPTGTTVEARLRNMRDTYRDRADLLLLDFQERILNRRL